MTPHTHALLVTAGFLALLLFASYRRIRRVIGRQPLQPRRMQVRMGLLAVVCIAFLVVPGFHPLLLAGAAAGAVLGAVLAFYSLKHTRFENTPEGVFYIGHPYIGLGVAALVIARIGYRFVLMSATMDTITAGGAPPSPMAGAIGNPITTGTFFVMAGYYLAFYAGLLRNRPQEPPATPPAQTV